MASEIRIGGKFIFGRKMASGAYGSLHRGQDAFSKAEVAIKIELISSRHPCLEYEYGVYRLLRQGIGIPRVYWFGTEGTYKILVLELLGTSLDELHTYNINFSLKTILMLSNQMISILETIHYMGILHRNLKPNHFIMGIKGNPQQLFLIDFGLAKRYSNPKKYLHIPYRENKQLIGLPQYASINNHLGIEYSRRDDLESLGYILIFILKGTLPWMNIRADNRAEKVQKIMEVKSAVSIDELCSDLPTEFSIYLKYCRNLKFDEKPDYLYLKKLFTDVFNREEFYLDFKFDWVNS